MVLIMSVSATQFMLLFGKKTFKANLCTTLLPGNF